MSKEIIPQKRPHKAKNLPPETDPARRLLAAVVLQCVADHLYPQRQTPRHARRSAAEFLRSEDGAAFLEKFGVSTWKAKKVLGRLS
jgi:hypothetical protein